MQPPPSVPAGEWDPVQDAAVREGGLWGPGDGGLRGLPLHPGEVPFEGGQLLQGPGWLLGALRTRQLPRTPVLPGEGGVPQTQ